MLHNLFNALQTFTIGSGRMGKFYSLPHLEKEEVGVISKLPVSIRIILEALLRNCDGNKITERDVRALANWCPTAERTEEIPLIVARILLQDSTGVPLLVDLAAMRSAAVRLGKNPQIIEPLVPVDLVVDHSVQVDYSSTPDALQKNVKREFQRNQQRYQFLKWGMQAFETLKVVPPGIGIVHQVNMEFLARGILHTDGMYYPDTLVGTDSHTTMINGLGIVGWGVGGIEAEASMLGQPIYFLTPDVVGVHLTGEFRDGVTATDLALYLTQLLRKANVVGKFVEYYGEGAANLMLPDRATIANMAPEYGATIGFFPIDEEVCKYLKATGRTDEQVATFRNYFIAQGLFGIPRKGECQYSQVLELNLAMVEPSVAGPKRPQDRIELSNLKSTFTELFTKSINDNGFSSPADALSQRFAIPNGEPSLGDVGHGDVLIAAITSCTNTSNPNMMLAAGLLAKKAVEKGLTRKPAVKVSLSPGSRVVIEYLKKVGLQPYLDRIGFNVVGYGCTTCVGNSGPLDSRIEDVVIKNALICASVLSGNRNFEARIHQSIKANFLMSPPLVIAFALAGRIDFDMTTESLGKDNDGRDVYLSDIWPSPKEINDLLMVAFDADIYRRLYANFSEENLLWNAVTSSTGAVYQWNPDSTYIQEPPFFEAFSVATGTIRDIFNARALAIFGDSITTDHISPAGSIKATSPAGMYLQAHGVSVADFNSYSSRRGNDRVMTRGTFANVRIRNLMVPGTEGGVTKFQPSDELMNIYDAAMKYRAAGVPQIVFAGQEYGTGSSRDWAAKGTQLLGVNIVIAQSFERIHRSNLVGMGVLPCQFKNGVSAQTLKLNGTETYDLIGLGTNLKPRQDAMLTIHRTNGLTESVSVSLRIDTPIEIEYYRHGGILPYMLRQLAAET